MSQYCTLQKYIIGLYKKLSISIFTRFKYVIIYKKNKNKKNFFWSF